MYLSSGVLTFSLFGSSVCIRYRLVSWKLVSFSGAFQSGVARFCLVVELADLHGRTPVLYVLLLV
jgi:hypothetical protein